MKPRFLFITGSDTGVGKTVLAAALTRHLREQGVRVAGLKPLCSGGREDAEALWDAAGKVLTLDEVNPWHFRAALAPVLAARKQRRTVRLAEVVAHIQKVAQGFEIVVVEGAGGLLSPMGEDFDSLGLLRALRAKPVIVCANRLGAVNQARLVLAALPPVLAKGSPVILMATTQTDGVARTNAGLLTEHMGRERIFDFPWLGKGMPSRNSRAKTCIGGLTHYLLKSRLTRSSR